MRVVSLLRKVIADERGANTLEFAIICAMIIIGLVSAVKGLADENARMWNVVSSSQAEAIGH